MQYSVGAYGGKFNPLHMGHLDCILQAANLCHELFIVLRIGNGLNEINRRIRYRWLYQLTNHIGNVNIIMVENAVCVDDALTDEYWRNEAEQVKMKIDKMIDVIFLDSESKTYGTSIKENYESELYFLPGNEINSTELNRNIYAHWDWLPNIVRPFYVKKVLLIGGESTGKTTLTINLANRFNTNYIDEVGREISERSGTNQLMLPEEFIEILLQQKLNEIKAITQSNKILFIDTDALVTQFYLSFHNAPDLERKKALSESINSLNHYDLILFLEPDIAFVQDGVRNESICQNRMKYSEQLKGLLCAYDKKYVIVRGSFQERYETAVQEVSRLLEA